MNIQGRVQKESLPRAKGAARRARGAIVMHICENAFRPTDCLSPTKTAPHFHFHNHRLSIRRANMETKEGGRERRGSPSSIVAQRPNRNVISLLPARCPHSFMRDPRVTGSTGRTFGAPQTRGGGWAAGAHEFWQRFTKLVLNPQGALYYPPNYISHTPIAPPHFCVSSQPNRQTSYGKHNNVLHLPPR